MNASSTNNPIADTVRGAVRPIVTVIFAAVIAQVVVEGIDPPPWFLSLAIPCIVWWFGERTLAHRNQSRKQE